MRGSEGTSDDESWSERICSESGLVGRDLYHQHETTSRHQIVVWCRTRRHKATCACGCIVLGVSRGITGESELIHLPVPNHGLNRQHELQ